MLVGRIAEPEHRKAGALKSRRLPPEQELIKARGRLRRVALAMRAGDQDEKALVLEFLELVVGGVDHAVDEAPLAQALAELAGEPARIARLGGEKHRDALIGRSRRRRRYRRRAGRRNRRDSR